MNDNEQFAKMINRFLDRIEGLEDELSSLPHLIDPPVPQGAILVESLDATEPKHDNDYVMEGMRQANYDLRQELALANDDNEHLTERLSHHPKDQSAAMSEAWTLLHGINTGQMKDMMIHDVKTAMDVLHKSLYQ
jgi:hypothetical protein